MGFCIVWASAASTTSRSVLVRSAAQSRKLDRNGCVATFKKRQERDWSSRPGSVSCRHLVNVKSHYDIPQEALNVYLDTVYRSYSCGLFERPDQLDVEALTQAGHGCGDTYDSLEKAQWRKFKDAVDFLDPRDGETLLDVGCGYGGQLRVGLDHYPFGTVVGWTHSHNQVVEGTKQLSRYRPERWEIHEGDFRQEARVFDHVTSTGMISHVGRGGCFPTSGRSAVSSSATDAMCIMR